MIHLSKAGKLIKVVEQQTSLLQKIFELNQRILEACCSESRPGTTTRASKQLKTDTSATTPMTKITDQKLHGTAILGATRLSATNGPPILCSPCLKGVSFNCHGFVNYVDLKSRFFQFDVIFLCETWLTEELISPDSEFSTFFIPASRSPVGRPAGGTLFMIRSSLGASQVFVGEHTTCMVLGGDADMVLACV